MTFSSLEVIGRSFLRKTLMGSFFVAAGMFLATSPMQGAVVWKEYDAFSAANPSGVLPSAATPAWTSTSQAAFFLNAANKVLNYNSPTTGAVASNYTMSSPGWVSRTGVGAPGNTVAFSLRALTLNSGATQTMEMFFRDGARRYRLAFKPGFFGISQTGTPGLEWYGLSDSTSFNLYTMTFTPLTDRITVYLNGSTTPAATGIRSSNDIVANSIQFGVFTTGTTGGTLEMDYITWTNNGMFTIIPEPSMALPLGAAGLILLIWRRSRRKLARI